MFNSLSQWGNVNGKYVEIPLYPSQNGYHQENKQQMLVRICGERIH
jgi:hypothetical protein